MHLVNQNIRVLKRNLECKKDFNCYIKRNWNSDKYLYSEGVIEPYLENIRGYRMEIFKEQLINIQILQKMLAQYRLEYENTIST